MCVMSGVGLEKFSRCGTYFPIALQRGPPRTAVLCWSVGNCYTLWFGGGHSPTSRGGAMSPPPFGEAATMLSQIEKPLSRLHCISLSLSRLCERQR